MDSLTARFWPDEVLQLSLSGNLERIKKILGKLARVENLIMLVDKNNNPLYMAAKGGHTHVCKYLAEELKFEANLNLRSKYGETPLIAAAKGGHYPVAHYLLERGADPNLATARGVTALHYAAEKGSSKLLHLLISKGAIVDARSESHGTPLHFAACGNEEAVKILLDKNAKPNINIPYIHTPLGFSIVHHSFQCVKLLVEAGRADVKTFSSGFSLLQLAAIRGANEIIEYLLNSGADPNVVDNGCTPLEHAGIRHNYKDVEILFPVTAPLPFISEWSIEEIIRHFKDDADGHKRALKDDKVFDLKINASYAVRNNEYSEAIQMYTEAMEIDPNDLDSLVGRAGCWASLCDSKSALDDAEVCIKRWPDRADGCLLKAAIYISLFNEPAKVADLYSQALMICPHNSNIQSLCWDAIDSEFYRVRNLCDLESLGFKTSAESRRMG